MSVVDLAQGRALTQLTVGDYPEGIAYSSRRDRVYVASWFDNALFEIDPGSRKALGRLPCQDGSRAYGQFIVE